LVERHTRYVILMKIANKDTQTVISALIKQAKTLPNELYKLSGGMAQRVCLALALMYRPRLLIADEPTAGLDVTIQRQMLDLMQKLTRETGTAQLIVTADLGIAAQYCDKIAVMRRGRIIEMNETRAFFEAPAHPYSRRLLESVRLR
jgi:ABC-type dipeptide/oligopeptide/nickel transport system ATPase component